MAVHSSARGPMRGYPRSATPNATRDHDCSVLGHPLAKIVPACEGQRPVHAGLMSPCAIASSAYLKSLTGSFRTSSLFLALPKSRRTASDASASSVGYISNNSASSSFDSNVTVPALTRSARAQDAHPEPKREILRQRRSISARHDDVFDITPPLRQRLVVLVEMARQRSHFRAIDTLKAPRDDARWNELVRFLIGQHKCVVGKTEPDRTPLRRTPGPPF
jgi:hypothetical protein